MEINVYGCMGEWVEMSLLLVVFIDGQIKSEKWEK